MIYQIYSTLGLIILGLMTLLWDNYSIIYQCSMLFTIFIT